MNAIAFHHHFQFICLDVFCRHGHDACHAFDRDRDHDHDLDFCLFLAEKNSTFDYADRHHIFFSGLVNDFDFCICYFDIPALEVTLLLHDFYAVARYFLDPLRLSSYSLALPL